jgi:manganese/zinc/iron transport system permease protein
MEILAVSDSFVPTKLLVWYGLACFFTALGCSQVGTFLVMRRMSLVGDAISHSVLPGIVIAFILLSKFGSASLDSPWLLIGAGLSGLLATVLIELIHYRSRIKQDAAIGIAFTSLFALGVLLLGLYAKKVDLDPDCVIFGQVEYLQGYPRVEWLGVEFPRPLVSFGVVGVLATVLIAVLYRILLVSSFDPSMAASYGYFPALVQLALMGLTSFVVVSAFQAVGAILVIALLILPGATAYLCANRLPVILFLAGIHALLSSAGGVWLALRLEINTGAAVVLAGGVLFTAAWLFGPVDGVVVRAWRRRSGQGLEPLAVPE